MFLAGGFSADLTHHVMHAIGGRMWGFTQELFDDQSGPTAESPAEVPPEAQAAMMQQMAERYPNIVAIATATAHDEEFRRRTRLRRPIRVRVRPGSAPRRL